MPEHQNAITDIAGLKVGHAHDADALTGVTVVLCESGAVAGVDVRGGGPATIETDALRPAHLIQQAHAIVLSGGSAFGLAASSGVRRYLEERGTGFDVGVAKVPIVAGASIFDLGLGRADVRPDAAMGYAACQNATDTDTHSGNVGAGMGASVGKILGPAQAMKTGLGTASIDLGNGLLVGALFVVNAVGDVLDPATGQIIAGVRRPDTDTESVAEGDSPFADTLAVMKTFAAQRAPAANTGGNTVIGVVATNARLTKEQVNTVAKMAHDGLARAIRPAHTMMDGDTIFALATGEHQADVNLIGAYAAEATAQAIVRAAKDAGTLGGLPGFEDI